MIRNYEPRDEEELWQLWCTAGEKDGYAPLDREGFRQTLTENPWFQPEHTFVLTRENRVAGFVNGCVDERIPRGAERGYVGCLLLGEGESTQENAGQLLAALEDSFRKKGRPWAAVTFFNPIHLPWVVPGTPGHQHNNLPGIPTDLPLHGWMKDFGYQEAAREVAMYLNLADYRCPDWVEEKARVMAAEGYTVAPYNPRKHWGLEAMLSALGNPLWQEEIPRAAREGKLVLAALKDDHVAGFTGPVWPEPSGRGYFTGIGVSPEFEHHGLGTLLFYRLLDAECRAGAKYMSLFTGVENPARGIYEKAGFQPRREFGVMLKKLEESQP